MTDNEMRIKIAELCGWKNIQPNPTKATPYCGTHKTLSADFYAIPDYLNDLNAMHEAEKELGYDGYQKYKRVLNRVCGPATHPIFSTARERAEAFLRVKGAWVESDQT